LQIIQPFLLTAVNSAYQFLSLRSQNNKIDAVSPRSPFHFPANLPRDTPPPLLKLGSILAIQKFNKQIKREIEKTFLIGCESVSTLLSPCLLDTRKNPPFQFLFFLFTGSGFLRRVIFDFYYLIKKKKGKLPKPLNNLSKLQNFSSTC
jgi:hypothetical protein